MSNLLLILTSISKIFFKNKKKSKKKSKKCFQHIQAIYAPIYPFYIFKKYSIHKKNDKIRNNIKKEDWWVKRKTKKKNQSEIWLFAPHIIILRGNEKKLL
jgi:glucan phosphoethanolaminetransferase (alkaline phosphatase superfamily)